MNDFTFQLLKVIVSVCVALTTAFLVPYIRTLRNDKRYTQMIDIVELAVRAAEQSIAGTGAEKKEWVIEFVRDWFSRLGVEYTHEQISELIEAAVYSMKQEAK